LWYTGAGEACIFNAAGRKDFLTGVIFTLLLLLLAPML
jgi:hypothetical protein